MRHALTALALLTLISGCATRAPTLTPPGVADYSAWWHHHQTVRELRSFIVEGRIAASGTPMSGRLRWEQMADQRFDIHVAGPVGIGSIRLRGTPTLVDIENRGGRFVTDQPESVLHEQLGWTLPISYLASWALGIPASGVAARYRVDAKGRLTLLEQAGWRVEYPRYHDDQIPPLPARMQLNRDDTTVTVLADRWRFAPP